MAEPGTGEEIPLRDRFAALAPHEIAAELPQLSGDERVLVFRTLPKDEAMAVFELLEPVHQEELLANLREGRGQELVEAMEPDDRARLIGELPAAVARRLLAGLSPLERELTATVLGYPEESAGRIMSPEVVRLRRSMTVDEALRHVRSAGEKAETVYFLPVTDEERHLLGAINLDDLVLADPGAQVGELAREVPDVSAHDDQEVAARLVREADLVALPVTDAERRLVGVVTFDDAMAVLEEEETEDIARAGASEPLRQPYLSVSIRRLVRARIVWLLVLIVAASLTVSVLEAFEDTLASVVTLAAFIPLLIGTGGNAGAQAATMVTRALAVGDVRFSNLGQVVGREVRVGFLLGGIFGLCAYPLVTLLFEGDIAAVVSLTLLAICTLATLIGSMLPILADRTRIDPAVVSAPVITTVVDASGLVIYFLIAQAVLGA